MAVDVNIQKAYEQLPEAVRAHVTVEQYAFMTSDQRYELVTEMTEPEVPDIP